MHERSLESVKVEPRLTSRLCSALFILPLFYLLDYYLRALTCVAKNASVEINLYCLNFCTVRRGYMVRGSSARRRRLVRQSRAKILNGFV